MPSGVSVALLAIQLPNLANRAIHHAKAGADGESQERSLVSPAFGFAVVVADTGVLFAPVLPPLLAIPPSRQPRCGVHHAHTKLLRSVCWGDVCLHNTPIATLRQFKLKPRKRSAMNK